jgi:hypothetical protein
MRNRRLVPAAVLALATALPGAAQPAFAPKPSTIPDAKLQEAVRKGMAFLKAAKLPKVHSQSTDSLVLYAFLHGGMPRQDPAFQKYLKQVVDAPPAKTYHVAVAAMTLSELDRVGYRWKLLQYCEFLVNSQCKNGQWSYGEKVKVTKGKPPKQAPAAVSSGPGGQMVRSTRLYGTRYPEGARPAGAGNTLARSIVRQTGRGKASGDNSNSQYAALGLRACAEAGLYPDPKCIQDAMRWWAGCQGSDGGWGYKEETKGGRGSLTAGGVGAVAIYDWMINRSWKKDLMVVKGVKWLDGHWTVSKNPGHDRHLYYYLYALERLGMIVGTDYIGSHDWYDEGARFIIKSQKPNGSWVKPDGRKWDKGADVVVDTCFAILFLRKATRPLVYSGH